jgi:hypothetical protein
MAMLDLVWLIPALPLAGFLLILLFGRKLGDPKAGYLATAMVGASFLVTVGVFLDLLSQGHEERSHVVTLFSWVPLGNGFSVDLAFLADPLSLTMCLFVTGIGSLIHLYAVGYMHGDPRFSKFFLYLNLFAFSMLMLVLGSNMLVTFLGWEGVGTCSYFLISFWHERESAATAGKKAFVTNRVGDWGFMMAMFFAFWAVGSLDYSRHQRCGWRARADHGHGHRIVLLRRCCGQERTAAPVPVAARRDGRPHAGLRPHPRGHHGHRRCVPDGAHQPGAGRQRRVRRLDHRRYRCRHGALRGHGGGRAERHQEGARVLHRQPAGLHVPGGRFGCLRGGHLPHGHARVLQGAAVPGQRFGHPRHAPRAGHAPQWARCAS